MPKRAKSYHTWLIERLSDPQEAKRYLNVAKSDSQEVFLKALRNVAEARKMSEVAAEAGVNRESLYKALSEEGNPTLNTLDSVLAALGLKIVIETAGNVPPPESRNKPAYTIAGFETSIAASANTTITGSPKGLFSNQPEFRITASFGGLVNQPSISVGANRQKPIASFESNISQPVAA